MTDGLSAGPGTDVATAGRRRTFVILVVAVTMLLLAMLLRSSYTLLASDLYNLDTQDREDRQLALKYTALVEDVFIAVGMAVLVIGLLYGALMDTSPTDLVRLGLLLAIAIIVGLFMARAMW